jgi:hypothetical protein
MNHSDPETFLANRRAAREDEERWRRGETSRWVRDDEDDATAIVCRKRGKS